MLPLTTSVISEPS